MEEEKKQIIYIPIEDILPNRFQPRLTFNEKELNELANSIIKYGVIQPIVVRSIGEKYEIIAGERRYKASEIAGLKKIPAILMETNDNTSAEIALLENLQRKNLTPIEEAKAYKKLLDRGFTQDDIATKLGVSQPMVANKIRLLNLPDEVQNALLYNQISERHARSLLALSDKDLQNNLLKRIIIDKLTVKQTEDEISLLISVRNSMDNKTNVEPGDLHRFLEPERTDPVVIKQDNDNLSTSGVEFLDLKIPEVVNIKDDDQEVEYKEETTVINPFIQKEQENKDILPPTINNDDKNIEINVDEKINMPSSPFNIESEQIVEKPAVTQKSIKEQLGEIRYEYKDPTVSDLNVDEEYNQIDKIEVEEEEIDENKKAIDEELMNEFGEIQLPKVINKTREFVNNLGSASTLIEVSEVDLPDKYQITIEIKKS